MSFIWVSASRCVSLKIIEIQIWNEQYENNTGFDEVSCGRTSVYYSPQYEWLWIYVYSRRIYVYSLSLHKIPHKIYGNSYNKSTLKILDNFNDFAY